MSDLKTAPVARRAFVAGIAGAAAATVAPAALAMTNRDPIFAAIEAHRADAVNEVHTGLENEPVWGKMIVATDDPHYARLGCPR